jgi:hypothetical protein
MDKAGFEMDAASLLLTKAEKEGNCGFRDWV